MRNDNYWYTENLSIEEYNYVIIHVHYVFKYRPTYSSQ